MKDFEKEPLDGVQYSAIHTEDVYELSDKEGVFDHPSHKRERERVDYSHCCSYYYRSLDSEDPALRRRAQCVIYGSLSCCTLFAVALVLFFTVVVPVVVRGMVHRSSLSLVSASLLQPSNASFRSSVVQRFEDLGTSSSVSASAKMHSLTIAWTRATEENTFNANNEHSTAYNAKRNKLLRSHSLGSASPKVEILRLSPENTLSIANHRQATLNALATVSDVEAMSAFTTSLITAESEEWTIDGSLSVSFMGVTTRADLHKSLELKGFDNFSTPAVVSSINVTAGTPQTVSFVADLQFFSLSNMAMDLGGQSLWFHIVLNGVEIGVGELPNFSVSEGETRFFANFTGIASTPEQYDTICYLMSQYSTGHDVDVLMTNFFLRDPIAWLSPALSTITMKTSLPGCETPLVQLIYLYMKPIPENLPYALDLYNPEPLPLIVSSIRGSLYYLGVKVATVDNQGLYIVIPPYTSIKTDKMTSSTVNTPAAAKAFSKFMEVGEGLVDLDSVIIGNFSEFQARIDYVQYNVTMILA